MRRGTLAVVVLVLVAGCNVAPSGPTEPTERASPDSGPTNTTETTATATVATTTTEDGTSETTTERSGTSTTERSDTSTATTQEVDIEVEGDRQLGFDQNQVFERVRTMLEVSDADPPPRIVFVDSNESSGFYHVQDEFFLTITGASQRPASDRGEGRTGIVLGYGDVSEAFLEFVLAHEYTHGIQFEQVRDTPVMESAFEAETHQQRRIAGAVIEGGASYVAAEYARTHMNRSPSSLRAEQWVYENLSVVERYAWAPYHYGRQYVTNRSDSAADHWTVYESPPNTTEQLIHGKDPAEEPPKPLSVQVDTSGSKVTDRDVMGELYLRIVLSAQLDDEGAASAAAGWGNDSRVQFEDAGYAWVIRWDDRQNASQFRAAMETYLDRRATSRSGAWRKGSVTFDVRMVDEGTIAILVGNQSFVDATSVSGGSGTVTLTVEDR